MEEISVFGDNPGKLRMFIHIPANLKAPAPLVVALHGCLQDAEELARVSGWNDLADHYGFVVVYPEQRSSNNMEKCFNWFMLKDIEGPSGELASIRSMMDHAAQLAQLDAAQTFVYGLSAGAAMANSLLANDPTHFKGGAILAGGPHKSAVNAWQAMRVMNNPEDLTPKEWWEKFPEPRTMHYALKVIVLHGEKDYVVDPRNAQEIIDQWSYALETGTTPHSTEENFAGNAQVQRSSYHDKSGEERIVYYRLLGLGHQLPVDPGTGTKQGGVDAEFTKDIDFFSTWYIATDFGLIPEN
jgi:poly(hydroxyalkanoate) depolymerase family esterase